jgi:thioredoxin 1
MVLRDGLMLASESGVMPGDVLDDLIAQVRALDMDDVRRQIQERRHEQVTVPAERA